MSEGKFIQHAQNPFNIRWLKENTSHHLDNWQPKRFINIVFFSRYNIWV